jgi:DNA-binding NarL/FixJ family response regulator
VQCAGRMGDPVLAPLVLSQDEQHTLENWAKRRSTAQDLALRARIVLASAEGHNNIAVAARLGVSRNTVTKGGPGSWPASWTGWVTSRVRGAADDH